MCGGCGCEACKKKEGGKRAGNYYASNKAPSWLQAKQPEAMLSKRSNSHEASCIRKSRLLYVCVLPYFRKACIVHLTNISSRSCSAFRRT